jgi:hypothetical protein
LLDPRRRYRQQAGQRVEAEVVDDLGQACGSDETQQRRRAIGALLLCRERDHRAADYGVIAFDGHRSRGAARRHDRFARGKESRDVRDRDDRFAGFAGWRGTTAKATEQCPGAAAADDHFATEAILSSPGTVAVRGDDLR